MKLILTPNQFEFENFNIFFCEPIKNNMLPDGTFTRIIISNDKLALNGVYLLLNFEDATCDKYFNKYKLCFNEKKNSNIIEVIQNIEESILDRYNCSKQRELKIKDQLSSNHIKLFQPLTNADLLLKISGVWETQYAYGITYKFYPSVL